jgi:hypothetical protein
MEPTMFLLIHRQQDHAVAERDRQLRIERLFAERELARCHRARHLARAWSIAGSIVRPRHRAARPVVTTPCPAPA